MGNIFITGGSRGMGRAVAIKFAREDHNVAVTYEKNRAAAENVVGELKALGRDAIALAMKLDDPGSIDAAFAEFEQHFGKLDYLFNNAGIFLGS
ncbi:MAG: SDR family NAD(P)-dependent oxidoreductase, partial [Proteobacteria bacterium]|nr:SDR family NAD(P)-dependent oxidoreductase [Pseudomonadota bacterium]